MPEISFSLKNGRYEIPAILCLPAGNGPFPAVVLCHGTGSCKNEAGNMFAGLAQRLAGCRIASCRFDFAACGDSRAAPEMLTFYSEVRDLETVFGFLSGRAEIDCSRMAVLGFSQGARVMAEFLKKRRPGLSAAVSWSGACQNGVGVFKEWFLKYYDQACANGYAVISLPWREDLILCKKWFDEIESSFPLDSLSRYKGPVLALAGEKDTLVPCAHAFEIAAAGGNKDSRAEIIAGADHIFNVFDDGCDCPAAVMTYTADWLGRFLIDKNRQ